MNNLKHMCLPRRVPAKMQLAISVGILLFGAGAGVSQTAFGEATQKEVRKALPVNGQSAANGSSERPVGTGSSENRSGSGAVGKDRTREINASRDQTQNAGEGTGNAQVGINTMKGLNDKRPIGIRDRLSLTIVEDELPQLQISVTDAGEIDVPYIGRVGVEGRTCKNLAMHIKSLLEREYYHQATVLIGLDSAGGQVMSKGRYYLDGQVNRGGPYEIPVDEILTISKAIIRGGGFTQYANRKKVRLIRKNSSTGSTEIYIADMVSVMEKGQTRGDIELMPDDKIFVDEKFFNF